MTYKMVENRVKKLVALKEEKEKLESEIKALESEIQSYMDAEGKEECEVGDWKVIWKLVSKMTFSSKAFKADHPDEYDKYKVESVSTYFKVNRKKGA